MLEALRYKPEGLMWEYSLSQPSGCSMALQSTQPLTEMSTSAIS